MHGLRTMDIHVAIHKSLRFKTGPVGWHIKVQEECV